MFFVHLFDGKIYIIKFREIARLVRCIERRMCREGVDWADLVKGRDISRALTVINLRLP